MTKASPDQLYRIEQLTARNLADVERLHAAVYGRRPPRGFFARKYDTSFTGVLPLGFLAYVGHLPAAYYGVLPCFIELDGERLLAAQSADTMTHPEHRHRGLFVRLAELTVELCEQHDVALLFGFPNQNSLPGFVNRLEWQCPAVMDLFVIPTECTVRPRSAAHLPLARHIIRYRQEMILRASTIPTRGIVWSAAQDGFPRIRRDDAWFRYKRYARTHVIQASGSSVWLKASDALLIGDLDTTSERFDATILALRALAKQLGARALQFQASPGTTLHGLFAARFDPIPSFPVIFKPLENGLPLDRIKFTLADIDIF